MLNREGTKTEIKEIVTERERIKIEEIERKIMKEKEERKGKEKVSEKERRLRKR